MVGAGRFERSTACAQDGFRHAAEIVYFQLLLFQAITYDFVYSCNEAPGHLFGHLPQVHVRAARLRQTTRLKSDR